MSIDQWDFDTCKRFLLIFVFLSQKRKPMKNKKRYFLLSTFLIYVNLIISIKFKFLKQNFSNIEHKT